MSILLALFLGIIQGLTEFLPVSSSGHLILFQHLFSLPNDMILFDIILHIATLCAVLIVFRKKIWQLIIHPFNKVNAYLLISTAITCTFVLLFKDLVDKMFTYKILPFAFLFTAIILFSTSFIKSSTREVGFTSSAIVGFTQFIATVPGISRSGTTISTLLLSGVKKEDAAEFSFLMSIPIIIASFLYELIDVKSTAHIYLLPTSAAFIAALICGIVSIKFMLGIIKKVKLHWFSLYLVILALVCLFVV